MGISLYWTISIQETPRDLLKQDVHPIQSRVKCENSSYFFSYIYILLLCVHEHTESEYEKWRLAYLGQYPPKKIKSLWYPDVHSIQYEKKVKFLLFMEIEIFLIYCVHQNTESTYEKWELSYIGQFLSRIS